MTLTQPSMTLIGRWCMTHFRYSTRRLQMHEKNRHSSGAGWWTIVGASPVTIAVEVTSETRVSRESSSAKMKIAAYTSRIYITDLISHKERWAAVTVKQSLLSITAVYFMKRKFTWFETSSNIWCSIAPLCPWYTHTAHVTSMTARYTCMPSPDNVCASNPFSGFRAGRNSVTFVGKKSYNKR